MRCVIRANHAFILYTSGPRCTGGRRMSVGLRAVADVLFVPRPSGAARAVCRSQRLPWSPLVSSAASPLINEAFDAGMAGCSLEISARGTCATPVSEYTAVDAQSAKLLSLFLLVRAGKLAALSGLGSRCRKQPGHSKKPRVAAATGGFVV
jgi:hypothetical protein